MVTLLCAALLSLITLNAPAAHAGGSGPIIHWDSSMIYAGQNNGYPWGPVGENTIVHGANFPPNTALRLAIAPGDSNQDATICTQPVVTIPITNLTTDATGSFTENFAWPSVAGQVNQIYSICSLLESNYSVASSHDDGPFTVLTSDPPVINFSASSVAAGGAITITGQNWVPQQQVSVNIAGCAACNPGNTEVTHGNTTSAGLNSGSFSLTLTIPAATRPGSYVVDALTSSGLEAFYTTGVKHLTITPSTTSNPSPTATAQSSPTTSTSMTATATTAHSPTPGTTKTTMAASGTTTNTTNTTGTGTSGANSSSNTGDSGNTNLVLVLVGIALILFLIAAVMLFILMRRRGRKSANALQQPVSPSFPSSPLSPFPPSPVPFAGQFGQPGQFNQASSSPGIYPPGFYPQQGQPVQTGTMQSMQQGYWQQPPGNNAPPLYGQATGAYDAPQVQPQSAYIPNCPNCGRPLAPNMPNCTTCGMPIALIRR